MLPEYAEGEKYVIIEVLVSSTFRSPAAKWKQTRQDARLGVNRGSSPLIPNPARPVPDQERQQRIGSQAGQPPQVSAHRGSTRKFRRRGSPQGFLRLECLDADRAAAERDTLASHSPMSENRLPATHALQHAVSMFDRIDMAVMVFDHFDQRSHLLGKKIDVHTSARTDTC